MRKPHRDAVPVGLYNLTVYGFGWLAMAFLIAPIFIAILMSLTAGQTLRFPPQGLSLKWYAALFDPVRSGTEQIAAMNSLKIAVLAVLGSFLVATPAAIGITRLRRKRALAIEPLLLSPLVLPSLVYGLAALVVANTVGLRPSFWLTVIGHDGLGASRLNDGSQDVTSLGPDFRDWRTGSLPGFAASKKRAMAAWVGSGPGTWGSTGVYRVC